MRASSARSRFISRYARSPSSRVKVGALDQSALQRSSRTRNKPSARSARGITPLYPKPRAYGPAAAEPRGAAVAASAGAAPSRRMRNLGRMRPPIGSETPGAGPASEIPSDSVTADVASPPEGSTDVSHPAHPPSANATSTSEASPKTNRCPPRKPRARGISQSDKWVGSEPVRMRIQLKKRSRSAAAEDAEEPASKLVKVVLLAWFPVVLFGETNQALFV